MRDALIAAALLACYAIASEMDYREAMRQEAESSARTVAVRIADPDWRHGNRMARVLLQRPARRYRNQVWAGEGQDVRHNAELTGRQRPAQEER